MTEKIKILCQIRDKCKIPLEVNVWRVLNSVRIQRKGMASSFQQSCFTTYFFATQVWGWFVKDAWDIERCIFKGILIAWQNFTNFCLAILPDINEILYRSNRTVICIKVVGC